jgi:hypothetical protein
MPERITLDHFKKKMEELHAEMTSGSFKHGEYDQRLARIIKELRDRKLDADRGQITETLNDLQTRGVITPSVRGHLEGRLGLA